MSRLFFVLAKSRFAEHRTLTLMATFAASDIEPLVILTGSPEEADRFLMSALWSDSDTFASVVGVLGWADVLRERGSDFASHAAACHYWLYERTANEPAVLQAWKRERNARHRRLP
jgi:hypothetical protein